MCVVNKRTACTYKGQARRTTVIPRMIDGSNGIADKPSALSKNFSMARTETAPEATATAIGIGPFAPARTERPMEACMVNKCFAFGCHDDGSYRYGFRGLVALELLAYPD